MRIKETYENTIVIQKSEFITRIFRCDSIEEVEEKLSWVRKKHYDAKHNCYAYILGDNQEIQKASDDGEPQKTAGAPILDVLKKNNMTNILAVVGLVRAYSSSTSECLKKAKLYDIKYQEKFSLTVSYQGYNTLLKVLPYINILETSFTDMVILVASCDIDKYEELKEDLYKYKISDGLLSDLGQFQIEVEV